ncbi:hypothetical protein [Luteimonas sp. MC1828]|uniref:hypothetical protein n=1 Tax=Luteimonas sp. MC1828 TaxID=2799787 RepID=UPI0018F225C1|nr:hypothetical protein [Luteimonas sp. MC1828]MBJ7574756.1 hypothetical protein [Luteimonas sp. MC1828]
MSAYDPLRSFAALTINVCCAAIADLQTIASGWLVCVKTGRSMKQLNPANLVGYRFIFRLRDYEEKRIGRARAQVGGAVV